MKILNQIGCKGYGVFIATLFMVLPLTLSMYANVLMDREVHSDSTLSVQACSLIFCSYICLVTNGCCAASHKGSLCLLKIAASCNVSVFTSYAANTVIMQPSSTVLDTQDQSSTTKTDSATSGGYLTSQEGYSSSTAGYMTTARGVFTTEDKTTTAEMFSTWTGGYSTTTDAMFTTEGEVTTPEAYSTSAVDHSTITDDVVTTEGEITTSGDYSSSAEGFSTTTDAMFTTEGDVTTPEAYSTSAVDHSTITDDVVTTEGEITTSGDYSSSAEGYSTTTDVVFTTEGEITTSTDYSTTQTGYSFSTSTTRNQDIIVTTSDLETTTSADLKSLTTTDVSSTTQSKCNGNSKYVYQSTEASMTDAQTVCNGLGGKVVEIETAEEALCLHDLFVLYDQSWYWIGAYNYNADSTYEFWGDQNTPLTFTNWGKNQPTKTSSQFCVYASWSSKYKWATDDCSVTHSFICEI